MSWKWLSTATTTNGPVVGWGGVSTRRVIPRSVGSTPPFAGPGPQAASPPIIASIIEIRRIGRRLVTHRLSDGPANKTGRGAFGPAHPFPIGERFLLGTSARKGWSQATRSPGRGRGSGTCGDLAGDSHPLEAADGLMSSGITACRIRCPVPTPRSLRPLGTGAKSTQGPWACQFHKPIAPQGVPRRLAGRRHRRFPAGKSDMFGYRPDGPRTGGRVSADPHVAGSLP